MKITVGLVANQPNGGAYVCGRTAGAELQIGSIAVGNYQTNVTFIDDGSVVTPSGQCGNLGSQYPFIDQAQYVGLNSYPTAFSAKLTAPNSIAASYTELLPLTATAGQLVDSANAAASVAGNIPSFSNATFRLQDSGKTLPLAAVLTTTAAATDNVTVTGMTSSGHCSLAATNASAATNIATTYISAKAANQITVTHTATASMTYDVICTAY